MVSHGSYPFRRGIPGMGIYIDWLMVHGPEGCQDSEND